MAELDGDHHAVAHALGANVVVRPVGDIGERAVGIGPGLEIDTLLLAVAVEELLEGAFDPRSGFGGARAELLDEEVAIDARRIGAGTVARRCGDRPELRRPGP